MTGHLGFLAMVIVLGAAACGQTTAPDLAQDRAALRALLEDHVRAVNQSDTAAILEQNAEDVVYLPPDAPVVLGRESLRQLVEPFYAENEAQIEMTTEELILNGDWAIEWGMLTGTVTPLAGDEASSMDSKYLYVYRRDPDGKWRIALDIYNSNIPPPQME